MWPRSPAKAALGEGESDLNGIFTIRPVAPQHRRGTVDVGVTEGAAAPALAGGVEERSTAMMGDWDHGRMMGGGYGGLWIVMVVFWILLLGLITFRVVRRLPGGGTREGPPVGGAGDPTVPPAVHMNVAQADFASRGLANVTSVDVDAMVRAAFGVNGAVPADPVAAANYFSNYHGTYEPPLCHAQARALFNTVR